LVADGFFADGLQSKPSAKNLFADGHSKPSAKKERR
jgi:hypothetical protein